MCRIGCLGAEDLPPTDWHVVGGTEWRRILIPSAFMYRDTTTISPPTFLPSLSNAERVQTNKCSPSPYLIDADTSLIPSSVPCTQPACGSSNPHCTDRCGVRRANPVHGHTVSIETSSSTVRYSRWRTGIDGHLQNRRWRVGGQGLCSSGRVIVVSTGTGECNSKTGG